MLIKTISRTKTSTKVVCKAFSTKASDPVKKCLRSGNGVPHWCGNVLVAFGAWAGADAAVVVPTLDFR